MNEVKESLGKKLQECQEAARVDFLKVNTIDRVETDRVLKAVWRASSRALERATLSCEMCGYLFRSFSATHRRDGLDDGGMRHDIDCALLPVHLVPLFDSG